MLFRLRPHLKSPSHLIAVLLLCCLSLLSWLPFLAVSASARSGAPASTSAAQAGQVPAHRRGEVLVRFRDSVSQNQKDIVAGTHRTRRKKQLRGESAVEKLELTGNDEATLVALQLSLNPAVEFAEPNFLIAKDQLATTPNDSRFPEQWALNNTGQNGGQYGSDIGVTKAWQTATGRSATVIALVDGGIDFTHPDLINTEWTNPTPTNGDAHGWDYITETGDIKDEQGHGTAIAGIIAAEGNNAAGISGVMWRASLMSLRVLDNTGTGDIGSAVEAIDYAVAQGAHVINLSWGTNGESLALKNAISRAIRRDVVVVCSAGNSGQDLAAAPYYPASFGIGAVGNWRSRTYQEHSALSKHTQCCQSA